MIGWVTSTSRALKSLPLFCGISENTTGAASPLPVSPLSAFRGGQTSSGAPRPFRATRVSNTMGAKSDGRSPAALRVRVGDVSPSPLPRMSYIWATAG